MNLAQPFSVFSFLFLTAHATAQICPSNDSFEPDNTFATATVIPVPYISPTLALVYPGGATGDTDVFQFTLAPGMQVIVDVTADVSMGPVFGSISGGANAGPASNFQLTSDNFSAAPVEVFLSLFEFLPDAGCAQYSFTTSLQAVVNPCGSIPDDALEDNDDCLSALPIGAGTNPGLFVSTLDVDFYRISVPPGQDAFVQIDYVAANGNVLLSSRESPCGSALYSDAGNGGIGLLSFTNPGPTATDYEVVISIAPNSPTSCNNYDLTTTFLPSVCLGAEDPFEDNDTCMERVPLPLGETLGLLLLADDLDWFGIDVPPGATLDISLTNGLPTVSQSIQIWTICDINSMIASDFGSGPLQVSAMNNNAVTEAWIIRIWNVGGSTSGPTQCNVVDMTANLTRAGSGLIETMCGAGTAPAGCGVCPCGNLPASTLPLRGCANSSGGGATLMATGAAFVTDDQLRFEVLGAAPAALGVLLSANNALPLQGPCPPGSGIGSANLDGIRCVGGSLRRHGSRTSDANGGIGRTNNGWGTPDGPPVGLIAQGGFGSGQTRSFQCFYRDLSTSVCMTGVNTSNAVRVTFAP